MIEANKYKSFIVPVKRNKVKTIERLFHNIIGVPYRSFFYVWLI